MSALSDHSPYGLKAIRQIKATNTFSKPGKPTSRLTKRKESTYMFFLEKVDPILGDCITHLLLEQPSDVPSSMINYLKLVEAKMQSNPNTDDLLQPSQWPAIKPKKEMKMFLAVNIAPIVSKLVNRIAVLLPDDVVGFMVKELESMIAEESIIPDKPEVVLLEPTSGEIEGKTDVSANVEVVQPKAEPKEIRIGLFGVDNAGKTTIVNILQGKYDAAPKPTIGFRPTAMMLSEDCKVKFYDLGGGKKIRDIWDQYYHDVHGVIYVLDASLSDSALEETMTVAETTFSSSFLKGKPLLVFANKQDKPNARPAAFWRDILGIPEEYESNLFIAECSAHIPANVENYQPDPNIESAIDMLLQSVAIQYDVLHSRVQGDCLNKAQQDAKKRIEKERKVLRNKIASAFIDQLSPEIVQALEIEANPKDIFSVEEGETFLAAEIGEEVLSEIGKQIAGMVGYQRLAMQIIGSLKVPISKKKTPMTWEEIHTLVLELRNELKLE